MALREHRGSSEARIDGVGHAEPLSEQSHLFVCAITISVLLHEPTKVDEDAAALSVGMKKVAPHRHQRDAERVRVCRRHPRVAQDQD